MEMQKNTYSTLTAAENGIVDAADTLQSAWSKLLSVRDELTDDQRKKVNRAMDLIDRLQTSLIDTAFSR